MTEPDEALLWARGAGMPIYQHHTLAEAYRAGAAASAERIKELEAAIQQADKRLQDYADMAVDQWNETVADGGITAWMVIRQELQTVVAGDLARALLKEPDQ